MTLIAAACFTVFVILGLILSMPKADSPQLKMAKERIAEQKYEYAVDILKDVVDDDILDEQNIKLWLYANLGLAKNNKFTMLEQSITSKLGQTLGYHWQKEVDFLNRLLVINHLLEEKNFNKAKDMLDSLEKEEHEAFGDLQKEVIAKLASLYLQKKRKSIKK